MSATSGLLLSIDQGTTNTKAALIDRSAISVFRTSVPLTLLQPQPGFVEQASCELWASVRSAMLSCAAYAQQAGRRIEGIAISNQRETAVCWQAGTGAAPTPIGNAISWQCRRSAEICRSLLSHRSTILHTTGLPLDPLQSAGKWAWALAHNQAVAIAANRQTLRLGTVDAWLLSCLTCGEHHATDLSNASRTGLLDLSTQLWSRELLGLFGVPSFTLPVLKPSAATFGVCRALPELEGVPIVAMIGDSHAAMAGHGSYTAGNVKATYGTGSSLMTLAPALPDRSEALARTIAWATASSTQFALEGNIAMAGSAVQWAGEFLSLPDASADVAALAETVAFSDGLYFVPAMVGLGAPHWDAAARGCISGIERSHTGAHLARAAIESIAFQVADVLFAMETELRRRLPALRADGGATRNTSLMQFQADILGRPVLRSKNEDLSLLGAAALGGLTLGWWNSLDEFALLARPTDVFEPRMTESDRTRAYSGWRSAVSRARSDLPVVDA